MEHVMHLCNVLVLSLDIPCSSSGHAWWKSQLMFHFSKQVHLKSGQQEEEQRDGEGIESRFTPVLPTPWGYYRESSQSVWNFSWDDNVKRQQIMEKKNPRHRPSSPRIKVRKVTKEKICHEFPCLDRNRNPTLYIHCKRINNQQIEVWLFRKPMGRNS